MEISQETQNLIFAEILNFQSSPEDPPIKRRELSAANNDATVRIQVNKCLSRKSMDMHKVLDRSGVKTLYLPRDRVITAEVKYSRVVGANLWVRVYPVSTNKECQNMSISSCSEHKKHFLDKHTNNNPINVLNSVLELNDPTAVYEKMLLPGGEGQITARVKYHQPDTPVYFLFKCYNTCSENLKKSLPKLVFSIESFNEEKEEFVVLSETSLLFKVCASPTRDFKTDSMALQRNRLSLKSNVCKPQQSQNPHSSKTFTIGAQKYILMMVDESELKLLDAIREFSKTKNPERSKEIEEMEQRASDRLYEDLSTEIKTEKI